jgi:Cu2+-containing amine oxidase
MAKPKRTSPPRARQAARSVKGVVKRGAKKTVVLGGAIKNRVKKRGEPDLRYSDPQLFEPLTEGERADALRVLTEDARLNKMAKVGRYRVVAVEPLVVKPPHELVGHRLARLVIYDYAGDRAVDACVDLDQRTVSFLDTSHAQPMLARDEEATAVAIALADERVEKALSLGDEPLMAMHYWSNNEGDLAYSRRSAAVIFGRRGGAASIVAVVDLLDEAVADVVPAERW